MIVKKYWRKYKNGRHSDRMGLFLFGFIPIYIEIHSWTF